MNITRVPSPRAWLREYPYFHLIFPLLLQGVGSIKALETAMPTSKTTDEEELMQHYRR